MSVSVTNKFGNNVTKSITINIEELIIDTNFAKSYYPTDNVILTFKNLIPETSGSLLLNNIEVKTFNLSRRDIGFFYPIADSGQVVALNFNLDGHEVTHNLKTIAYELSENPEAEIAKTKDAILNRLNILTDQKTEFANYTEGVGGVIDAFVETLVEKNDPSLLKWASLILKKELSNINNQDLIVENKHSDQGVFSSLFNFMFAEANAITFSELESRAIACDDKIGSNNLYRYLLMAVKLVGNATSVVTGISAIVSVSVVTTALVSPAAQALIMALIVPITNVITNIIAIGDHKRDLIFCSENVNYPINCSSNDVQVSFEGVPIIDNKRTYRSGVRYNFSPKFTAGNYNFVKSKLASDSNCDENKLGSVYKTFKEGLTLYNFDKSNLSSLVSLDSLDSQVEAVSYLKQFGEISDDEVLIKDLAAEIVTGVLKLQDKMVETGVKAQLDTMIETITNEIETPSASLSYTDNSKELISVKELEGKYTIEDEKVLYKTNSSESGFYTFVNVRSGYLGKVTIKVSEKVGPNIEYPINFNVTEICPSTNDVELIQWHNGLGLVSESANLQIDQRSFVDKNSAICQIDSISGFVHLAGGAIIDAPRSSILAENDKDFVNGGGIIVYPDISLIGNVLIAEKAGAINIDVSKVPSDRDDGENSIFDPFSITVPENSLLEIADNTSIVMNNDIDYYEHGGDIKFIASGRIESCSIQNSSIKASNLSCTDSSMTNVIISGNIDRLKLENDTIINKAQFTSGIFDLTLNKTSVENYLIGLNGGFIVNSNFSSAFDIFDPVVGEVYLGDVGGKTGRVNYSDVNVSYTGACVGEGCGISSGIIATFSPVNARGVSSVNSDVYSFSISDSVIENVLLSRRSVIENVRLNAQGGRVEENSKLLGNDDFNVNGYYFQVGNVSFSLPVQADSFTISGSTSKLLVFSEGVGIEGVVTITSDDSYSLISDIELTGENNINLRGANIINQLTSIDSFLDLQEANVATIEITGGDVSISKSKVSSLTINSSVVSISDDSSLDIANIDSGSFLDISKANASDINASGSSFISINGTNVYNVNARDGSGLNSNVGMIVNNLSLVRSSFEGYCSAINATVINFSTVGNNNLEQECKVENSTVSDESFVSAYVSSSTVSAKSRVIDNANVSAGSRIVNSTISGDASVSGAKVTDPIILGSAVITKDKTKNTCDGANDTDPDDY
ncbi:hypothetical protein OAT67_06125 [Bacteriovoracaceae bacterium]|nr:hypothetical protein [Bacteriovoracaceae bacterium]